MFKIGHVDSSFRFTIGSSTYTLHRHLDDDPALCFRAQIYVRRSRNPADRKHGFSDNHYYYYRTMVGALTHFPLMCLLHICHSPIPRCKYLRRVDRLHYGRERARRFPIWVR